MASNSSKSLPFLVLAIVIGTMAAEVYYEIQIDLQEILPLLIIIGIGGAAKVAVEKAAEARKSLPKPIEDLVKKELEKLIEKGKSI